MESTARVSGPPKESRYGLLAQRWADGSKSGVQRRRAGVTGGLSRSMRERPQVGVRTSVAPESVDGWRAFGRGRKSARHESPLSHLDTLWAGGRAHVRRLLHRPEQGVRLQPDGLQLRAHPVGGDCQRDATALTTIAQTLSPAVTLNPKTRIGSCPETLRTRCESVWNASTPAKKMTTSRFVMAGGCEAP